MDITIFPAILTIAGAFSIIGGAYQTFQKITAAEHKKRLESDARLLHEAKEITNILKRQMESEFKIIRADLSNLEDGINKDISYVRETYTSELNALKKKIESLRQDLKDQSSKTLELLIKLVNK